MLHHCWETKLVLCLSMNSKFLKELGFRERRNPIVHSFEGNSDRSFLQWVWGFFFQFRFEYVGFTGVDHLYFSSLSFFIHQSRTTVKNLSISIAEVFLAAARVCYRGPSRAHMSLSRPFSTTLKCSKPVYFQSEIFSKIMNHSRNLLELSAAGSRVGKPPWMSPCSPADAAICCGALWGHVCFDVGAKGKCRLSSHSFIFPMYGCSVSPTHSISSCGYTTRHQPERMVRGSFKKGLFVKMLLRQVDFVGNPGSSWIRTYPPGQSGHEAPALAGIPFPSLLLLPASKERMKMEWPRVLSTDKPQTRKFQSSSRFELGDVWLSQEISFRKTSIFN